MSYIYTTPSERGYNANVTVYEVYIHDADANCACFGCGNCHYSTFMSYVYSRYDENGETRGENKCSLCLTEFLESKKSDDNVIIELLHSISTCKCASDRCAFEGHSLTVTGSRWEIHRALLAIAGPTNVKVAGLPNREEK